MLKKCKHCDEVFGSLEIASMHRKDDPIKAKCIDSRAMRKKGMWRGMKGVWWAVIRENEKPRETSNWGLEA